MSEGYVIINEYCKQKNKQVNRRRLRVNYKILFVLWFLPIRTRPQGLLNNRFVLRKIRP